MSPRIRIEIVGDEKDALRAFRNTEKSAAHLGSTLRRSQRDMDRFGRGVVAGSGVLGGLGRSVAFASSAFLGGAGLLYAYRRVTTAAKESQVIQVRLAQAVRNAGQSWIENRKHINSVIEAQSRLSAFEDEDLSASLAQLVVRTKDVNRALTLNAIAANVARGRGMALEAAGRLVLKASIGQAGALRRLGLDVGKTATKQQLLTALQAKFAGQAEAFGRTAEGAQQRWNKTLNDSEEIIGRALLPRVTDLLRAGTKWLEQQNRSGNLQRTVNANLRDAVSILGGVKAGLQLIKTATEPVVDAVGGVENAVTALTVLYVGMKAKAIFGFASTATASALTRTKIVSDAAAIELALDAATRPRVVPIEIVGGGIPGLPGKVGKYGTGKLPKAPNRTPVPAVTKGGIGGFLSRAGRYLGPVAAGAATAYVSAGGLVVGATIAAIVASAGGGTHREDRSKKYPRVYDAVAAAVNGNPTPAQLAALQGLGKYSLENAPDKVMRQAEQQLRRYERYAGQVGVGHPPRGGKPKPGVKPKTTTGGGGGGSAGRTLTTVDRELARARALGSDADVNRLLREEKGIMTRQIHSLEKRGFLNKTEQAHLDKLYADLASVNAELEADAKSDATDAKKASKATAAAHKKAAKAAKDAADKLDEQWQNARQQASQAFGDIFSGPTLGATGLGDFFKEFGAMGAKLDPKLILQDIRQQNAQSAALVKNLQTIAKRGAPVGMMNQLRALGPEGAAFASSIANAPKQVFDAIVAAFAIREKQIKQATVFIQARNVTVKTASSTPDRLDTRKAGGGMVMGSGIGDTVPAMLTPGELVLNKMQQGGLAKAMGMAGATPQGLFGAISRMASGGTAGGGGGFGGGEHLDGRPWFKRRGPRNWGLNIYGPDPRVPMRPDIHEFLARYMGHGLSPAQARGGGSWWSSHFGALAQGFAGGGVVQRFNRWASEHKPQVGVLTKVGEWLGKPTGGNRQWDPNSYLNRQGRMFGEGIIPTPAGVKAMTLLARDLGLGYLAPPVFGLQDPKARARAGMGVSLMARGMIDALRNPIANAGFLASMLVPLPGPGKVTGPTRALERFQAKLAKVSNYPEVGAEGEVALQASNLRLRREKISNTGLPRQFNRAAAESTAAHILQALHVSGKKPSEVLPPGVRTLEDIVQLQHDLFNAARAGKVGKDWYAKSGRDLLAYAGGDRGEAKKLALLAALYSPRVSVEESMRRAASAWTQYKQTRTVPTKGVFDYQPGQAMAIMDGSLTKLNGRKVNNFFLDLMQGVDPRYARKHRAPGASTVDVWMQKAFGYAPSRDKKTGKWSIAAPNAGQYDFSENIVAGIAAQLGWTPQQAQAAIWTTTKSRFEKRPPGRAALNLGDYMARQSTQINYEAAYGTFGSRIKTELGDQAARVYAMEKFALLRNAGGGSAVLERLGLLGKPGEMQQGVWGVDVNPGMSDLMLAPRFPENKKRFRMLPRFERSAREAAAIIGYVLNQQGVGTLTEFPMRTAAGTMNANVRAGRNAVWLSRKFDDKELAKVSGLLGTKMLMLPRGGGWILKPASNRVPGDKVMATVRQHLEGFKLQEATAASGYVDNSEYMKLIQRAAKRDPELLPWVMGLRKQADAIDRRWGQRLMGPQIKRAGGGMIPGLGSRDSVPALLTPGEMVLNRKQQLGVSQALGLGRSSGGRLFGEINRFQHGGVLTGRPRQQGSFLAGSSPAMQPAATFEQHNTITVPPHFADTEWAVERGLSRATWRLKKGI